MSDHGNNKRNKVIQVHPYTLKKLRRSDLLIERNHRFNKLCRGGLSYPGLFFVQIFCNDFTSVIRHPFFYFLQELFPAIHCIFFASARSRCRKRMPFLSGLIIADNKKPAGPQNLPDIVY